MTPRELREKNKRKTITTPVNKVELRIRRLGIYELETANLNYILSIESLRTAPGKPTENEKTLGEIANDKLIQQSSLRYILSTTEPKIGFWEEQREEVPDGAIDASWIADDLGYIADQIIEFTGFTPENTAKVEGISKNENSPAS